VEDSRERAHAHTLATDGTEGVGAYHSISGPPIAMHKGGSWALWARAWVRTPGQARPGSAHVGSHRPGHWGLAGAGDCGWNEVNEKHRPRCLALVCSRRRYWGSSGPTAFRSLPLTTPHTPTQPQRHGSHSPCSPFALTALARDSQAQRATRGRATHARAAACSLTHTRFLCTGGHWFKHWILVGRHSIICRCDAPKKRKVTWPIVVLDLRMLMRRHPA
jgi:hypothetical protein